MPSTNRTAPCHGLIGTKINEGRLQLVQVLGEGAYGVVYKARDLTIRSREHFYAVKVLSTTSLSSRQRRFLRRELSLHALVSSSSHPNILPIHSAIQTPDLVFVVLAYFPDGDLFSLIVEQQRFRPEYDALISHIFLQICEGVRHCHEVGVYHRDLKPENVLCKRGGEKVVIADFGLATDEKRSKEFGCGSSFYMSPEVNGGLLEPLTSYASAPNDIWSLGVILVNLVTSRNPFTTAQVSDPTFLAFLHNPDHLQSILPISDACNIVLKAALHPDSVERATVEELIELVKGVRRWTMSEEELMGASETARTAAVERGDERAIRAEERLRVRRVQEEMKRRCRASPSSPTSSRLPTPRVSRISSTTFSTDYELVEIAHLPSSHKHTARHLTPFPSTSGLSRLPGLSTDSSPSASPACSAPVTPQVYAQDAVEAASAALAGGKKGVRRASFLDLEFESSFPHLQL